MNTYKKTYCIFCQGTGDGMRTRSKANIGKGRDADSSYNQGEGNTSGGQVLFKLQLMRAFECVRAVLAKLPVAAIVVLPCAAVQ